MSGLDLSDVDHGHVIGEPGQPVTGAVIGYYGSKHRLADWLISLMPEHKMYVEPFAGSLSVLARKPPVKLETVNDVDENLMTFWRVLRTRTDDLERACLFTPHSRAEHAAAVDLVPDPYDEIEHARRVWVRLSQGRAGQLRRTGWRNNHSSLHVGSSMAGRLDHYVGRFAAVAARLRNVTLECRDGLDVIADYGQDPDALLYVDPPYLGSTRTGNTSGYAHELASEDDHRLLAETLARCEATVLLSGYTSPLYEDLYRGWSTASRDTWTNQGSRKAARVEVVWSNRPLTPLYGARTLPDLFDDDLSA